MTIKEIVRSSCYELVEDIELATTKREIDIYDRYEIAKVLTILGYKKGEKDIPWHIIKDKDLPLWNGSFLVVYKHPITFKRTYAIGKYDYAENAWFVDGKFNEEVYAWQELPELPKEK